MVVGNVPKLHAFIGIVAAVVAMPIACSSEFEGCKASRTCPSNDAGEAGGGADTGGTNGRGGSTGEAGGGDGTGGSSGMGGTAGSGGMSGGAGNDDGGVGGSGDDTTRPTVVSFSPGDGDADVERDVTVTAELSEPIDEATVTSESVTLSGPDGDVSGTVSLAENVISFVPDEPLSLLATYTFTLSDTVADLAGNTLAQDESAEFRGRDGRWSEPEFPFGTTVSRGIDGFQRNSRGDAVLEMAPLPSREAVYGAVYDAARHEWTAAAELTRMAGVEHANSTAAIDSSRRAVLAWGSNGSWSRFDGASTWNNGSQFGSPTTMTATPSGTALAVWVPAIPNASTLTIDLSSGQVASPVPLDVTDYFSDPVPTSSLERLGILWARVAMDNQHEIVIAWKEGSSWGSPEVVGRGTEISSFRVDSDEAGNVIVVWGEGDQILSRIYERSRNAWTRELPIAASTSLASLVDVDITSGNAIVSVNSFDATEGSWAAIYRPGSGWIEDTFVRLDDPGIGYSIEVSIDSGGNALAVWQSELKFRRYVAGEGWQSASSLDANVDEYPFYSAGAPDGSVLVVTTDLERNPDGLPMTVRFE